MADYRGEIVMIDTSYRGKYLDINYLLLLSTPISDITGDNKFGYMLERKVQI